MVKTSSSGRTCSQLGLNKAPFCQLIPAQVVNGPFRDPFITTIFAFLPFSWWFCCFQWPPHAVLSGVSEHKKAGVQLTEKIYVLVTLYSGMNYTAVGC